MNSENAQQQNGEFKKVLGIGSLVIFGLAYMAPTVVFNYYGPISVSSKGMYPTCFVITAIAMFFTAFSYANMSREFQKSGSAYVYVQQSLNPHIGFVAGWVMLLDYLLLPMICILCVAVYMETYVHAVPAWVWVVIIVGLLFLVNALGISVAAKVDTVIVGAQLLMMALFIIVGVISIVNGGIDGDSKGLIDGTAFYNPDVFEMRLVLYPAAILCVSFLGFDAVSTLSEEAKNPVKDIPRAIVLVCLGAGVIFTLIAYIAQVMWPTGYLQMEDPDSGIFELLAKINTIPHMDIMFLVVDNIGSVACALSGQAAVIRIMYNMGRDNILPKKFFGHMSKKGVPVYNLIIVGVIGLVAIFFTDNIMGGVGLVSFGALTGFVLVNISVPVLFLKKKGERGGKAIFNYAVLPLIATAICVYLWFNMAVTAKIIGLIWLAIGIIILAIKTKGFRQLPPEMDIE
jgi:putrescine importer